MRVEYYEIHRMIGRLRDIAGSLQRAPQIARRVSSGDRGQQIVALECRCRDAAESLLYEAALLERGTREAPADAPAEAS